MEILNRNMNAIKYVQPDLYIEIMEIKDLKDFSFNISVNDNICVLQQKNHKGDFIQYNSFFDPDKEAKEITSSLNYNINRSLYLIIGLGLGYCLKEVFKNINEKDCIIILEKNISLLKEVFKIVDFSKEIGSRKVYFICGKFEDNYTKEKVIELMRKIPLNIMNIQPIILPVIDIEYMRYANQLLNYFYNFRDTYFFGVGNDLDDTIMGLKNRLSNIISMIKNPGLNELKEKYKDIYKNKPAIIVASGPSLDKNISELKNAEGKALILACDGSLESLRNENIKADAVGSVERIILTYKAFYENKIIPEETVLTVPAVVRPEIIQHSLNKNLSFFKKGETYGEWLDNVTLGKKGTVWCGASVAHMMFGLAYELGCNPIILVGQDLAYSKEGISHVKYADKVKHTINLSNVETYVKGIDGELLPSTYVWEKFLKIFEEVIRKVDRIIIDATEGGAYISGAQNMLLKEAIDRYCNVPVDSFRTLLDNISISEQYIEKALINSLNSINIEIKRFNLYRYKAHKALILNEGARNLMNRGITTQKELNFVYDAIDYTENEIVKKIIKSKMIYMMFQYPIYGAASKINNLDSQYTFDTIKENLEIQRELLQIIELYCKKTMRVLFEGLKYLETNVSMLKKEDIKTEKMSRWIYKYITESGLDVE